MQDVSSLPLEAAQLAFPRTSFLDWPPVSPASTYVTCLLLSAHHCQGEGNNTG